MIFSEAFTSWGNLCNTTTHSSIFKSFVFSVSFLLEYLGIFRGLPIYYIYKRFNLLFLNKLYNINKKKNSKNVPLFFDDDSKIDGTSSSISFDSDESSKILRFNPFFGTKIVLFSCTNNGDLFFPRFDLCNKKW